MPFPCIISLLPPSSALDRLPSVERRASSVERMVGSSEEEDNGVWREVEGLS